MVKINYKLLPAPPKKKNYTFVKLKTKLIKKKKVGHYVEFTWHVWVVAFTISQDDSKMPDSWKLVAVSKAGALAGWEESSLSESLKSECKDGDFSWT